MSPKLITIDEHLKNHADNITAAAEAVGSNYFTFRRWIHRETFAPERSSSRKLMAEKGIDLPRRPAKAARRKG